MHYDKAGPDGRYIRTVSIRMTVHSKEWDSSAHKYFIHQTAKILISII